MIGYGYDEKEVIAAIANGLDNFYKSLIDKTNKLDIKKIMKRKTRICTGRRLYRTLTTSFLQFWMLLLHLRKKQFSVIAFSSHLPLRPAEAAKH